jgi:hypothetical protein
MYYNNVLQLYTSSLLPRLPYNEARTCEGAGRM